jgi:hypothetical protein
MADLLKAINELQNTSIPAILAIGGLLFILLAFVGRIAGKIELPPGRQKWAGAVGVALLLSGMALAIVPTTSSGVTPTPPATVAVIFNTPASIPVTLTDTPIPNLPTNRPVPDLTATLAPEPTNTPSSTVYSEAQQVGWGPAFYNREAGICINHCIEFIAWSELKEELQQQLLPQISQIPAGSMLELKSYQGKPNWVVQIVNLNQAEIANVWLGPDPYNDWEFDGLVRVGSPGPPAVVWGTFQRYADGSYRRQ